MPIEETGNRPAGSPVAGLVLAAGAGRRYGMPKALVSYEGDLLVDRAVTTLHAGGCEEVVVVLGAAAIRVRSGARLTDCRVVENPEWECGMGSSLRAGLSFLSSEEFSATVVVLVDMPAITPEAVERVLAAARRSVADAIVMAGYGKRRGHPVLLGRSHWDGVAALAVGDTGARPYLQRRTDVIVVPCDDVAADWDIDTPGDTG